MAQLGNQKDIARVERKRESYGEVTLERKVKGYPGSVGRIMIKLAYSSFPNDSGAMLGQSHDGLKLVWSRQGKLP